MDKYRVIVLREGTDADETLFEIAGPATMVAKLAPAALLDALVGDAAEVAYPGRDVADRVFDQATAAGAAAEAQATTPSGGPAGETEAESTKRKRRTKAQIAADNEAQGLGFRDAAHRAEVESQQQVPAPTVAATTTFEGAAPVPPAVPTEVPSGFPAATSVPATPPAAPAGDAPPWNPFTQS